MNKAQELLTGDIWKQVNKLLAKNLPVQAAIAYVTSDLLKLKKGDLLICNASSYAISNGETSAQVLEYYHKKGIIIFSHKDLHAKCLLTKDFVVIGSSNLSANSATRLVESALKTNDRQTISQMSVFFYELKEEAIVLTEEDILQLKKIPVTRKPVYFKNERSSRIKKNYGNKTWVLESTDLSDKLVNAEKEKTERAAKQIAEKYSLNEESIAYYRISGNDRVSQTIKPGDLMMFVHRNDAATRFRVSTFNPVLKVEKDRSCTRFYYDSTGEEEIPWTAFERIIKKLPLSRAIKKRSYRELSPKDAALLKTSLSKF